MRITTEARVNEWLGEVQRWHDVSKDLIARLSPVEAEIYETLDWIEAPDFRDAVNVGLPGLPPRYAQRACRRILAGGVSR